MIEGITKAVLLRGAEITVMSPVNLLEGTSITLDNMIPMILPAFHLSVGLASV